MAKTRHQAFTVETVNRRDIKIADYNPRSICARNRENLKEALADNGLVETLVVNRRTGTLVSGHQRLSVLDTLEAGTDYSLDVAMVDVDERTEAKLNVQLNQRNLQGEFDFESLERMMDGFDFGALELGFDEHDIEMAGPDAGAKERPGKRESGDVKSPFRVTGQSLENHFRAQYPSVNPYDIPDIFPQEIDLVGVKWASFNERHGIADYGNTAVHCYNEDYQINVLWTHPDKHLELLKKCRAVVAPDFSMYTDMPKALLVYNAYRRQWVGRYWQENGVKVIPSCSYPEGMIEDYMFAGIPKNGTVATSNAYTGLDADAEIGDIRKIFGLLEPGLLLIKASDYKAAVLEKYFRFERIPTYAFAAGRK